MADESANPGRPAADATGAPSLPAAVDRATFEAAGIRVAGRTPHRPVAAPGGRTL